MLSAIRKSIRTIKKMCLHDELRSNCSNNKRKQPCSQKKIFCFQNRTLARRQRSICKYRFISKFERNIATTLLTSSSKDVNNIFYRRFFHRQYCI